MTDFRALCAELIQLDQELPSAFAHSGVEYSDWKRRWCAATTPVRAELGKPEGEGPDHVNLIAFAYGREPWATWLKAGGCLESAHCELSDLMADVLARWGRPTIEPVAVSERLPEDADCLVIPPLGASTFPLRYCWQAREIMHCGQARLIWDWKLVPHTTDQDWPFTYWLPASTRFLPTTVDPAQPT
jgi:hypothetical protein